MPVATVGDDAEVQRDVTEETIREYADLTGDENPLHTDTEYAAEGFFGGIVAHGMLGAGLISAALASLPGDIVYLSQDLAFEAPVRPGDTVRASVAVVEELGDDRVRVETVAEAVDGDGAKTVIDGEAVVLSVQHGE
ncbi:MaoC family dehydratase [Halolamina sp. CBA1230]|uniref:MaoC family dehydratase n=1 Tax=Halolamina sp. CBA1230 TaxID=1853690 RepID=UPI0009A204E3|nr:MaoC family dehydratase [Halolamina sp. CBA1230]QKY19880.1 MaoC family dehydratase [Halolamina sp. CBA1230]